MQRSADPAARLVSARTSSLLHIVSTHCGDVAAILQRRHKETLLMSAASKLQLQETATRGLENDFRAARAQRHDGRKYQDQTLVLHNRTSKDSFYFSVECFHSRNDRQQPPVAQHANAIVFSVPASDV